MKNFQLNQNDLNHFVYLIEFLLMMLLVKIYNHYLIMMKDLLWIEYILEMMYRIYNILMDNEW